jgi:glutamine synthetase
MAFASDLLIPKDYSELSARIEAAKYERIRFTWCDLHGALRSKTLLKAAALRALQTGVGMAGTLMLKDHADKTAFPVFDDKALKTFKGLERFQQASNVLLRADPQSLLSLPWDNSTGLVRCETWFPDGTPVAWDTRRILREALKALATRGWSMRCGLEIEFHVYKIKDRAPQLNPLLAAWPGQPPELEMLHPGYRLIGDDYMTMCEVPMAIIERTALSLGLPLQSLEIEFGPSQLEAVFDATDALSAADHMVLFRNLVRQALGREGYYASFVCRPPFPNIMSSGWHLHQSLVNDRGENLFAPKSSAQVPRPTGTAQDYLSETGCQYLAGLLEHAQGMAAIAVPTINGYERFRPNALAPQTASWGYDSRSAMLRVVGGLAGSATRIENRLGEPMANPYLYMASQIYAGLDGISRNLKPPLASALTSNDAKALPMNLEIAASALQGDDVLRVGFDHEFVDYYAHIARATWARFIASKDPVEFHSREYFSRF